MSSRGKTQEQIWIAELSEGAAFIPHEVVQRESSLVIQQRICDFPRLFLVNNAGE